MLQHLLRFLKDPCHSPTDTSRYNELSQMALAAEIGAVEPDCVDEEVTQ